MQRHTLPLRPLLGTLLLGLLLAGCDASRDDATALGPVPIASGDECHVCGMLIEEMPGPKGEAVLPGAVRKFCSTAELFGWWLQPENRQGQARLYVHDMSQADWRHPDDARLIDATRAYYVVGIQRPGGMGATLASFADEEAATRLAAEEGGRVLRFDEIDQAGAARRGRRPPAPAPGALSVGRKAESPCRGYGRGFLRLARRGAAEAYFSTKARSIR